jgi:hypothetical protein
MALAAARLSRPLMANGMTAAHKRFGVQKFKPEPCDTCGAPRRVINGAWLRREREIAGMTLREMARRLDYSAAYLCDVEHNRRHCSPRIRAAYEALRAVATSGE